MARKIGDTISNLFTAMAIAEKRRETKEQEFQDAIRLKKEEAKIKQEFESPLGQLMDFTKLAKGLSDIGIDPKLVFGRDIGAPAVPTPGITPRVPEVAPTVPVTPGAPEVISPLRGAGGRLDLEPTAFERTPFGGMRPTKFAPRKGLTGETAGKFTMLQQALSDVRDVRGLLFEEKPGKEPRFLRGLAAAAAIPGGRAPVIGHIIPDVGFGTKARLISSKINNALEAKLRIETGAAATQEEFNRLQDRFGISVADTAKSATDKLDRLEDFLQNAIVTIDPTGKFTYDTGDKQLDKELNVDVTKGQARTPSGISFSFEEE